MSFLENIKLNDKIISVNNNVHTIAFEGVDGCGKSSLCEYLCNNTDDYKFVKIPKPYVTMPFREYLVLNASDMASALIYTASMVERKNIINNFNKNEVSCAVLDRSLWSTLALKYVLNPECFESVLRMFESIAEYLPIPDTTYVLNVPYEICRERICARLPEEQRFDVMSQEEYNKHMSFYLWLEKQNVGVKLITPQNKSIAEIALMILNDNDR